MTKVVIQSFILIVCFILSSVLIDKNIFAEEKNNQQSTIIRNIAGSGPHILEISKLFKEIHSKEKITYQVTSTPANFFSQMIHGGGVDLIYSIADDAYGQGKIQVFAIDQDGIVKDSAVVDIALEPRIYSESTPPKLIAPNPTIYRRLSNFEFGNVKEIKLNALFEKASSEFNRALTYHYAASQDAPVSLLRQKTIGSDTVLEVHIDELAVDFSISVSAEDRHGIRSEPLVIIFDAQLPVLSAFDDQISVDGGGPAKILVLDNDRVGVPPTRVSSFHLINPSSSSNNHGESSQTVLVAPRSDNLEIDGIGILANDGDGFIFKPSAGFQGQFEVIYYIEDAQGRTDSAKLKIMVDDKEAWVMQADSDEIEKQRI